MKEDILNEYQQDYGAEYSKFKASHNYFFRYVTRSSTSIAIRLDEKICRETRLDEAPHLWPDILWQCFGIEHGFFPVCKRYAVHCLDMKFSRKFVPKIKIILLVDWRPILQPRLDYKSHTHIDLRRVDMATALAIQSGFDPGKLS